ncbi:MAG: glutamate racemase [Gemmatimonadales bacterium]
MGFASDPRPIGLFDSGVGGLTVLSEVRRRLPGESTIYLGDTARAPYGPRSADEVRSFTLECTRWLLGHDIKLLLLACNTATSQALPLVRAASPVPVLGVVRPGALAAAASTRSGHVGVVATAGTVASGAYPVALDEVEPSLVVTQQACPRLVPLVEAGTLDGAEVGDAVRDYLGQLIAGDPAIDTLLLGCTHYPLLRPLMERTVGRAVAVVDSAFTTALAAEELLDALGTRAPGGRPAVSRVYTTGEVEAFTALADRIFPGALPGVEQAIVTAD